MVPDIQKLMSVFCLTCGENMSVLCLQPFGVNQPGPYVMYTTVDSNGDLKIASGKSFLCAAPQQGSNHKSNRAARNFKIISSLTLFQHPTSYLQASVSCANITAGIEIINQSDDLKDVILLLPTLSGNLYFTKYIGLPSFSIVINKLGHIAEMHHLKYAQLFTFG